MAKTKQLEKDYAKTLFVNENISQKEIATRLKVTEKTIGKWVKDGNWETMKKSMLTTKENQLTMMYDQLDFLNTDIKGREFKIATPKEADIISKLTSAINRLETETSIGDTVEVAKKIIQFVRSQDVAFAAQLTNYFDGYITSLTK
ncbi:DDE transposase family protein [Flavobacterium cerinum]|uniref:DDE transposase family protein n=1 Tax=Flavobacterium cerinum TaxID=2502784 RepID=A0A444HBT0_9FLAO|nr:DDE transposase family protein [Flavobacterium cerinum]RWX00924.1 DDE transposase family protein [Flavobacterium cerinum]